MANDSTAKTKTPRRSRVSCPFRRDKSHNNSSKEVNVESVSAAMPFGVADRRVCAGRMPTLPSVLIPLLEGSRNQDLGSSDDLISQVRHSPFAIHNPNSSTKAGRFAFPHSFMIFCAVLKLRGSAFLFAGIVRVAGSSDGSRQSSQIAVFDRAPDQAPFDRTRTTN